MNPRRKKTDEKKPAEIMAPDMIRVANHIAELNASTTRVLDKLDMAQQLDAMTRAGWLEIVESHVYLTTQGAKAAGLQEWKGRKRPGPNALPQINAALGFIHLADLPRTWWSPEWIGEFFETNKRPRNLTFVLTRQPEKRPVIDVIYVPNDTTGPAEMKDVLKERRRMIEGWGERARRFLKERMLRVAILVTEEEKLKNLRKTLKSTTPFLLEQVHDPR